MSVVGAQAPDTTGMPHHGGENGPMDLERGSRSNFYDLLLQHVKQYLRTQNNNCYYQPIGINIDQLVRRSIFLSTKLSCKELNLLIVCCVSVQANHKCLLRLVTAGNDFFKKSRGPRCLPPLARASTVHQCLKQYKKI
ncbi:hypothetical protein CEXT_583751 [Caerostris extrusa]|uniref:Uncharacterized protein n=1 Tax=Caerostris extrusa TaxID=172846 RepID=A0AAV4SE26_CAEEX|nr:hypothetical protein CEXT_583751 [Caerostris extrusa]